MKQLYYILTLAACLIIQASCSVTKRTTEKVTQVHDTVAVHDTVKSYDGHSEVTKEREHDSTIIEPGYDIAQTFTPSQLAPATTPGGYKVPHSYHSDKGNLHSTVSVDTAGRITITCQDDSLKAVIQMLREVVTEKTDSLNTLHRSATAQNSVTSESTYSKIVKFKMPFWFYLIVVTIILILLVEAAEWVYRKYKSIVP